MKKFLTLLLSLMVASGVYAGVNSQGDISIFGTPVITHTNGLNNITNVNTIVADYLFGDGSGLTGIAGSTKIGHNCMIGGQVGIAGHITIGNNVRVQGQSGVSRNIKDGEVLQGTPSLDYKEYYKSYVHFKNLPTIVKEIEKLKKNSK